jgi:hypothetical protein
MAEALFEFEIENTRVFWEQVRRDSLLLVLVFFSFHSTLGIERGG